MIGKIIPWEIFFPVKKEDGRLATTSKEEKIRARTQRVKAQESDVGKRKLNCVFDLHLFLVRFLPQSH